VKKIHEYNDYPLAQKELSIVIPAYNEEKRIAITIGEVIEVAKTILDDFEIIIIDDGSRDKTYLEIQKAVQGIKSHARIIRHDINQGVGSAFHMGLKLAKFPQLCLVPGDNAFNIESIKTLFSQCGILPLVISYRQNMEARTPLRFALSRIATFFLCMITGVRVKDAHSLYLFPVGMTRDLAIKAKGYGYHIEILSRLLNRQKKFVEVPVILNPKPDASSGVMKPKTLLILGLTLSKLFGLRLLGKL
jgi:dolichol-phosphate mannosyltransferase